MAPPTKKITSPASYFKTGQECDGPQDLSAKRARLEIITESMSASATTTAATSTTPYTMSTITTTTLSSPASMATAATSVSSSLLPPPEFSDSDHSEETDPILVVDDNSNDKEDDEARPESADQEATESDYERIFHLLPLQAKHRGIMSGGLTSPVYCKTSATTKLFLTTNFNGWLPPVPGKPKHQQRGFKDGIRSNHRAEAMTLVPHNRHSPYSRNEELGTYDIQVDVKVGIHFDFMISNGDHLILTLVPADPAAQAHPLQLCKVQNKQPVLDHPSHKGKRGVFEVESNPICPDLQMLRILGHDVWQLRNPEQPIYSINVKFRCPSTHIQPPTTGLFYFIAQGSIQGRAIATCIPIRTVQSEGFIAMSHYVGPPLTMSAPQLAGPPPTPPPSSGTLHYLPHRSPQQQYQQQYQHQQQQLQQQPHQPQQPLQQQQLPQQQQQPLQLPQQLARATQQLNHMAWLQQQQQQHCQHPHGYPLGQRQQLIRQQVAQAHHAHPLHQMMPPSRFPQPTATITSANQATPVHMPPPYYPSMSSQFGPPQPAPAAIAVPASRGFNDSLPMPPPPDSTIVQRLQLAYQLETEKAMLTQMDVLELLYRAQSGPLLHLARFSANGMPPPPPMQQQQQQYKQ